MKGLVVVHDGGWCGVRIAIGTRVNQQWGAACTPTRCL